MAGAADVIPCTSLLAKAAIAAAQAVLAERGEWALNEKGIVERAERDRAAAIVAEATWQNLDHAVTVMRDLLSRSRSNAGMAD